MRATGLPQRVTPVSSPPSTKSKIDPNVFFDSEALTVFMIPSYQLHFPACWIDDSAPMPNLSRHRALFRGPPSDDDVVDPEA
jgi:hypothetical protein